MSVAVHICPDHMTRADYKNLTAESVGLDSVGCSGRQSKETNMSSFASVNLLEVEDSVGERAAGVEGRFGRKHLASRDLGISLFRYAANLRSPMAHSHREQEEAYVVVSGSGRILLDDEVQDLRLWDVVRVAPEVIRAFEAGPDGLDLIAVGGPKPEGGDGVMGTANWPDSQ
jgi:quercetin dioxygenase-like cupin family protein